MPFARNDRRYKCFCGCCRSTTGALIIGILDVVLAALALWIGLTGYVQALIEYSHIERQGSLAGAGIFGIIGLLAVFGVVCKIPCLLIFHMVIDVVTLLSIGILAVFLVIIKLVAATEYESKKNMTRMIIMLCTLTVFAVMQIWFFLIMLGAYRCLTELHHGPYENQQSAYVAVANNGSATSNVQKEYFYGNEPGGGATPMPCYTPMLSTPNYYKQQPLYTATSPHMYG